MKEPIELTEDQVPQGVIDDLVDHFGEVTFALDEAIDADTHSLKSNYVDQDAELVEGTVLDAKTFQPVTTMGYHGTSYLVRVNEGDNGGAIVKRVITMSLFNPCESSEEFRAKCVQLLKDHDKANK